MTIEELKSIIKEVVQNEMSPYLEAKRRLPAEGGEQSTKEKLIGFVRSLSKGLAEGTPGTGGFLVPEEFRAEVLRIAKDVGYALRFATKIPMKSDVMNIPSLSSSVSVSWVNEGAAGTESTPAFQQVQLIAKKMLALTVISSELLEDASIEVVDLLTNLFAEAIASEVDKQVFTGNGSPFTGILSNSNVNVVNMATGKKSFKDVSFDNLIDAVSLVNVNAKKNASWFMHPTIVAILRKIKDKQDQYIWAPPIGTNPATILGYPVYEISSMPTVNNDNVGTPFIAFGDLKYVYIGLRSDMTVEVLKEATIGSVSLGQTDQQALRIRQRMAIAITLPGAFSVIKTAVSGT